VQAGVREDQAVEVVVIAAQSGVQTAPGVGAVIILKTSVGQRVRSRTAENPHRREPGGPYDLLGTVGTEIANEFFTPVLELAGLFMPAEQSVFLVIGHLLEILFSLIMAFWVVTTMILYTQFGLICKGGSVRWGVKIVVFVKGKKFITHIRDNINPDNYLIVIGKFSMNEYGVTVQG